MSKKEIKRELKQEKGLTTTSTFVAKSAKKAANQGNFCVYKNSRYVWLLRNARQMFVQRKKGFGKGGRKFYLIFFLRVFSGTKHSLCNFFHFMHIYFKLNLDFGIRWKREESSEFWSIASEWVSCPRKNLGASKREKS